MIAKHWAIIYLHFHAMSDYMNTIIIGTDRMSRLHTHIYIARNSLLVISYATIGRVYIAYSPMHSSFKVPSYCYIAPRVAY